MARPCVPHMPSGPHMAGPNVGATSASELCGSVVCDGRSGLSGQLPQGRECSARSCRQGLHVIHRERADSGLGPVDTAKNLQCGASTSQRGEEEKAGVCGIPLAASGSPFCSHGLGREQGDSGPCFTSLALQGAGSHAKETLGGCGLWPGHTPAQSRSWLYLLQHPRTASAGGDGPTLSRWRVGKEGAGVRVSQRVGHVSRDGLSDNRQSSYHTETSEQPWDLRGLWVLGVFGTTRVPLACLLW